MEAMATETRMSGDQPSKFPQVITCPHEMVAMSMADGFARLTGKPQCVIVHVDVGTQMLGCAMHNSSIARSPVLVFAGLSPYTLEGELRGSRTEYIHWLQDAPDQKQIVSQYCRYAGEIKTGRNVKQIVNRALQMATSDPKGPSYLVAAREVMEEDIEPYDLDQSVWTGIAPSALPPDGVEGIVSLLAQAERPLIIVGYTGRNHATVPELVKLAESIPGIRVLDALGSDVCFPFSHRSYIGVRIGKHESISNADAILVIDCDVPWIPTQCTLRPGVKIIQIDVDPLKQNMPLHYIPSTHKYRADSETALRQLNNYIATTEEYSGLAGREPYVSRWRALETARKEVIQAADAIAAPPSNDLSPPSTSYLCSELRKACPKDTIWCIEAVSNAMFVYDQLRVDVPGNLVNGGGGGLGWSGGGTIGVKLASDWLAGGGGKGKFVCEIVGDGTYLFGVPGTVYWVARRYQLPTLTVVLSNKGWNAPRHSLELVHPTGHGSKVSNEQLNISFSPTPDFSGIAQAASGNTAYAKVVRSAQELRTILPEAIAAVQGGVSAIIEARIQGHWNGDEP
ncbi:related to BENZOYLFORMATE DECARBOXYLASE [Cephalotrichum gorgonifer]|uniref:Related to BENZOYLFORMATE DECARBOXYLASE n=1 Tax=Cephalotrichum gorgonifer TaxID=2041049 RepID=A0AAE8SY30_9PEZI|nr:related to BENZOYLFORMATE DECARBOXYLASE [Cephalotrichum gorgonifer]